MIGRILGRDQKALTYFYRKYMPLMKSIVILKISSPEDQEEILQDAMFAALDAIRDFEGRSTLKTLLLSILNHKIIDYYRRRKITQVVFSKIPEIESILTAGNSPEEAYEAKALAVKINQALNLLVPRYRRLLVERYINKKSVADVAGSLSLTVKSVECRLFRARKAFARVYLSI